MTKEKKLNVLEGICTTAIGFTVAAVIDKHTDVKGPIGGTLVAIGATAIAIVVAGKFSDEFAKVRKTILKES